MSKEISNCYCTDCGSLLVATMSGVVCPNGHGKIRVDVTRLDLKHEKRRLELAARREKKLAAISNLPLAKRLRVGAWKGNAFVAAFLVEGMDGVWWHENNGHRLNEVITARLKDSAIPRRLAKCLDSVNDLLTTENAQ
jgi:hypothetical protein